MTTEIVNHESGEVLSVDEAARLRIKEHAIERGADEVAKALATIRDERLYRANYATFETYCQRRWGIKRDKAYRMIERVEVAEVLSEISDSVNEAQARELADLRDDPDALRETYQKAHEATGGNVTAKAIRDVRNPEPEPTFVSAAEALAELTDEVAEIVGPDETVDTETGEIRPRLTVVSTPAPRPSPEPASLKPVINEDEWTEQDRAEELAADLAAHLSLLFALTVPERRAEFIANWHLGVDHRPVLGQKYVKPSVMREIADALHTFATEWENANV